MIGLLRLPIDNENPAPFDESVLLLVMTHENDGYTEKNNNIFDADTNMIIDLNAKKETLL